MHEPVNFIVNGAHWIRAEQRAAHNEYQIAVVLLAGFLETGSQLRFVARSEMVHVVNENSNRLT